MNSRTQRVPVDIAQPTAPLHCFRDNQIRMDSVFQRREQGGLRTASKQPDSQPHQICGAQSRQRPATALPTLHTGHIDAELLGQLDLGKPC